MKTTMMLIAITCLAACAPETDDIVATEEALWSVPGGPTTSVAWGASAPVGAWATVDCLDNGPNTLLDGLQAWKEPSSNFDNFVARLEARCYGFEQSGTDFVRDSSAYFPELMYTAGYRNPGTTIQAPATRVPIGLRLRVNPGEYVKNLAILSGDIATGPGGGYVTGYTTPVATSFALDYPGTTVNLICPEQNVMRGLIVGYTISNGKIRSIAPLCSELSDI